MKSLMVLLALVSTNAFAYNTPNFDFVISPNKTVTLTVYGDESASSAYCNYTMTWFEGMTFKRYWGAFNLNPGDVKSFEVKNDIATRITRPSAEVTCDYIDG